MEFHHGCILCGDEEKALDFYVEGLGLEVFRESFSPGKNAKKFELYDHGKYLIELFINPDFSKGEKKEAFCRGLDHLSFLVDFPEEVLGRLQRKGWQVSAVNIDRITGKKYGFTYDPDGQKIEFYEK